MSSAGLPIILNVAGSRCVVIGGGPVARRRAESLLEAGAEVIVVAPNVDESIGDLKGVIVVLREYEAADLIGAKLVIAATDDKILNDQITREARERKVLVNRADEPASGDFVVPAHGQVGSVTVAVHTDGASAYAAAAIRDELMAALDEAWPQIVDTVRPYRELIKERVRDAKLRVQKLRSLTDRDAIDVFKHGGREALERYLRALVDRISEDKAGGESEA